MALQNIGGFGSYQNLASLTGMKQKAAGADAKEKTEEAKGAASSRTSRTGKTGQNTKTELSDKAQKLLEKLKDKYQNMDIMVADYADDKEASSYLSRGTKEYSVLMTPDTLEEMASSKESEDKYTKLMEESAGLLEDAKNALGEDGKEVASLGITIDKDGSVKLFAQLEKMSEETRKRTEQIQEDRKAKAEDKAEAAKKAEKKEKEETKSGATTLGRTYGASRPEKTALVEASTAKDLVDKIKNFDWSQVAVSGGAAKKLDLSV